MFLIFCPAPVANGVFTPVTSNSAPAFMIICELAAIEPAPLRTSRPAATVVTPV